MGYSQHSARLRFVCCSVYPTTPTHGTLLKHLRNPYVVLRCFLFFVDNQIARIYEGTKGGA